MTSRSHLYPWIEERNREAAEGLAVLSAGYLSSMIESLRRRDMEAVARLALCFADAKLVSRDVILDVCREVSESKGQGYAGSDDFLANFYRVAQREDIPADKVLAVYVWKHIDWLSTYEFTGKSHGPEGAGSRLADIVLYAALGAAIQHRAAGRPLLALAETGGVA